MKVLNEVIIIIQCLNLCHIIIYIFIEVYESSESEKEDGEENEGSSKVSSCRNKGKNSFFPRMQKVSDSHIYSKHQNKMMKVYILINE